MDLSYPDSSPRRQGVRAALAAALVALTPLASAPHSLFAGDYQGSGHPFEYEEEPVRYSKQTANDPVAQLDRVFRKDRTKGWVNFDANFGYLPAVLELLKVPVSSQMLVFSKTSLQRSHISPDNPRALYFSDNVYVGFIPGAPDLEVAAVDPNLGAVFYTVHQDKDEPLRFRRSNDCLSCHGASRSMGVPGFVLRSLDTQPSGEIVAGTDAESVTHFTPIEERWGGWYATGVPSDWRTRANQQGNATGSSESTFPKRINPEAYPGKGSDVTALLVHDHQTHMHNYFTRISFEARQSIAMYGNIRYMRNPIDALVRYLLFAEEAPLPGPIDPSPDFVAAFQKNARRDSQGRSLRDLDLQTRLFKYPCSFLIESDAFDQLPEPVREQALFKIWEVLTCQNEDGFYASLSQDSKRAALEILRDTLPHLPNYWMDGRPE